MNIEYFQLKESSSKTIYNKTENLLKGLQAYEQMNKGRYQLRNIDNAQETNFDKFRF